MRNYEVALVVHPEVDEEAFNALMEKIQGWITSAGGKIGQIENWGRRRLAYLIRKQREGQYVFIQAQMAAAASGEVERNLRLTEQVMRFLITRLDA